MSDKGFRFRLASVLRVGTLRKQVAHQALVVEAARVARAEREALERQSSYEVRPDSRRGPVVDLQQERTVADLRAQAVRDAEGQRHAAANSMLDARAAWLDASRHARSIERLEERHQAAYAMVAARAAQRALDDLVRRRRAGGDDGAR